MLRPRIVIDVPKVIRRNLGILAPAMNKVSDPIQQLFIDKIREFKQKSSSGKLEMNPAVAKLKKQELEKITRQYGGGSGVDMTQFPTFQFKEPTVEVLKLNESAK